MNEMKHDGRDALDEREGAATAAMDADAAADDATDADAAAEPGGEADRAQRELAALNDRHLRLAAEFDNYRKRTERERSETWSRSQADLAATLLEALDDLQRVGHIDADKTSVAALLEGVQLVERKLQRALGAAGLEEVEAEGRRFDPSTMEALMTVATERAEDDDVVAGVLQKGYRFKGHLLRPARVQVRKYHG
jgi:molecular chaperone GrpE